MFNRGKSRKENILRKRELLTKFGLFHNDMRGKTAFLPSAGKMKKPGKPCEYWCFGGFRVKKQVLVPFSLVEE
jgi:hypothetical protein